MVKKNYDGNLLKTDGYFITSFTTTDDVKEMYILYRNGIVLDLGSRDEIIVIEEELEMVSIIKKLKIIRMYGVYLILIVQA